MISRERNFESVLPRSIATREAFLNAMTLDIAMGGSTNTVLHLLAVAHEAGADFKMDDIDILSRKTPCLCKVAPNTQKHRGHLAPERFLLEGRDPDGVLRLQPRDGVGR